MKYIVLISIFTAISANAADFELFYLVGNSRMSADSAIIQSIKGETVYKCQSVETKVSKSGTSVSLKNVKKPKAE
jgi:hypothetical protein